MSHLRQTSHATTYGDCMPAPVAQQAFTATKIIMGEDGTNEGKGRERKREGGRNGGMEGERRREGEREEERLGERESKRGR